MRSSLHLATFALLCVSLSAHAQPGEDEAFEPASFERGNIPGIPPLASAGGLALLELSLSASGIVTDVVALTDAPPYTEALRKETTLWRFRAATEDGRGVASKILVLGLYRPPVLVGGAVPTIEPSRAPSPELPWPTTTVTPQYPPNSLYEGVALVEVTIDSAGTVVEADIISAEESFDPLALEAASEFRFRPARRRDRPVVSRALIAFGFTQPITPGRRRHH